MLVYQRVYLDSVNGERWTPRWQVPLSAWLSAVAAFLGTTLVALDDQVTRLENGVALQSLNIYYTYIYIIVI